MKRINPNITFFLFLTLILVNYLSKAENNSLDSVSKKFPEVRVEATRIFTNSLTEYSPVTILNKNDLKNLGNIQLSEALVYVPALFIKDYGGLGGMKTISVRGTSANQTIILLNGIRLNSSQNGMMDLSNIPLSLIDNVEIVKTGFSAVYGGNSIGGAVNLMSDISLNDKVEFAGSFGSFNENFLSINASKSLGKFKLSSFFEYKHSDGDYPISISHFGNRQTVSRSNASFTNYSAMLNGDYLLDNLRINTMLLFFSSERGVPGAVLQGFIESSESALTEEGIMGAISLHTNINSELVMSSGYNFRFNNMNFKDKNLIGKGGLPIDNDFISDDYNFNFNIKKSNVKGDFQLNIEAFHTQLKGDMLQPDIKGNPQRQGFAVSLISANDYEINKIAKLLFAGAFRTDFFSDNQPAYSPFAGLVIEPKNMDFSFKLNVSSNFRMPSFNELYYLNYGTSELRPEKSLSMNFGINYKFYDFNFEINTFRIITDDLIIAVPKSPAIWSAQNIGRVNNQGVEFSAKFNSANFPVKVDFNYTRQIAEDRTAGSLNYGNHLVYVPQEIFNASLVFVLFWEISGISNFNYASFRYSLASNDISSVLPSYYTINLKMNKKFDLSFSKVNFYISADNITDERFAIVRNFPMPGRILRSGFSMVLSEK